MDQNGETPDQPANGSMKGLLHFLARDPKYATEKPYTVRFDTEGKFPFTNIENAKHEVEIHDMRPLWERSPEAFDLERNGFQVVTLADHMTYEDFDDDELLRSKHIPQILSTVQSTLKSGKIHVLDYRVRKRHAEFPIRSGEDYSFLQPSSRVHLDYSAEAVEKTVKNYANGDAATILDRKWQAINVWHPLRGPCVDWPLAVCDATTVNFADDSMTSDYVASWGSSENAQIHFSPEQKWYYLRDQMPNELLVFKSADSESARSGAFPGTPHGAFENPLATSADLPRQSFEIRLLVTW